MHIACAANSPVPESGQWLMHRLLPCSAISAYFGQLKMHALNWIGHGCERNRRTMVLAERRNVYNHIVLQWIWDICLNVAATLWTSVYDLPCFVSFFSAAVFVPPPPLSLARTMNCVNGDVINYCLVWAAHLLFVSRHTASACASLHMHTALTHFTDQVQTLTWNNERYHI